jgi:membrane protease YdiL (CAAX protease family)
MNPLTKDSKLAIPETDGESRAALRVSIGVLLSGALIIAFLSRYNLSGRTFLPGHLPRTWEEYLLVNIAGLLFVPFLLVFGLFREKAEAYGFRPPEPGAARLAFFLFLLMLPILLIASRFPDFRSYYPMQPDAARDWGYFFYFEVTYGLYMFCWEWFYRGFLTFGLARRFGYPAAIILQTAGFGLMHWSKPMLEFQFSFLGGAILGWLAVKSRSFLPCFALHWAVSVTFDALAIHAKPGGIF